MVVAAGLLDGVDEDLGDAGGLADVEDGGGMVDLDGLDDVVLPGQQLLEVLGTGLEDGAEEGSSVLLDRQQLPLEAFVLGNGPAPGLLLEPLVDGLGGAVEAFRAASIVVGDVGPIEAVDLLLDAQRPGLPHVLVEGGRRSPLEGRLVLLGGTAEGPATGRWGLGRALTGVWACGPQVGDWGVAAGPGRFAYSLRLDCSRWARRHRCRRGGRRRRLWRRG